MSGFLVAGTDTDAGKTAFSLLWMAAFADRFAYWKPVETGDSDTETVRRLVPPATVLPPLARFREPVAPYLAAEREGQSMPGVGEILAAVPESPLPLVIETFGSPLSPLTADVLQIELIAALSRPVVLVTPSRVGAVGRALQSASCLKQNGAHLAAVVLLGPPDDAAARQIEQHARVAVCSLQLPDGWAADGVSQAAEANQFELTRLCAVITASGGRKPPVQVSTGGLRPPLADLIRRDRAAVWHPYTSLADPDDPLPVVGAEAEFLHLADGRPLIDAVSSWWTIQHGHRHPPLVAALHRAAEQLDHVLFAGATHPPAVELAERLLATMPWTGGRVFYSDNGSTAVEVALKMAYQAWCHRGEPQRTLFVGFEDGYHGDTFGAMAAGRDPLFFGTFEPLLFRALRIPVSAERLTEALERHRGVVAAVILEPLVQGAGGMKMHPPGELRAIHEVCKQHGIYLIADEVMTGGGRTGSLWAHQQAGIAPDLVCAAKTLTGGLMPLAATLASPEVVAAFDTPDRSRTFFHGHSYTAHPMACAVAAENWRNLATGQWQTDVRRIESFWRESLSPLTGQPGVKDVRFQGSIVAVELDVPGGYLADVGRRMRKTAIDRGVLLRPLGNVLYAMPPYRISNESLTTITDVMRECVRTALPSGPEA